MVDKVINKRVEDPVALSHLITGPLRLKMEEKQELLGRHLSSVEDLVRDLRNSTPFGGVVC